MDKKSAAEYAQVVADQSAALRSLAAERDAAVEKLASMARHHAVAKLAAQMHEKGLHLDQDLPTLSASLAKEAEQGKLPVIQEAVDRMAPNMGVKLGSVSDETQVGVGATQFEQFILGKVG